MRIGPSTSRHTPGLATLLIGAGSFVVAILVSVLLLVPINNRAMTWADGEPPSDWRAQLRRWDRLHYLRLVIITVAFVLVALGAVRGG